MNQWTYSRIDRIELEEVHCVFCHRPLRSGRVIVLSDENGTEAYAGPACARKHAGAPTEQVIDLSKMAMSIVLADDPDVDAGPSDSAVSGKRKPTKSRASVETDACVLYLNMRLEHMRGFAGYATQKLRDCHTELSSPQGLSAESRLYIGRLQAKAKAANTIYSYRNVEHCIGAAYWLRLAIEQTKSDRRDFLEKMLRSLQEHWRLTAKQIEAINRWGEVVRKSVAHFPKLDPAAFDGVSVPRFSKDQKSAI